MRQIMINLDYQSRTPIYEQIVNGIEKYVALGILKRENTDSFDQGDGQ